MVVKAQTNLKSMARDFESVKTAASTFVHWANDKLHWLKDDTKLELEVEATLPQERSRLKKRMPGELADDES